MNFFFKQKTAYEIGVRLVGSEMCIRDSLIGNGISISISLFHYRAGSSVVKARDGRSLNPPRLLAPLTDSIFCRGCSSASISLSEGLSLIHI